MTQLYRLIVLALSVSHAFALPQQEGVKRQSTSLAGTNIQLLPLGDSITFGLTDPNQNGYRGPLYSELQSAGVTTLNFIGSVKAGNFADPDNEGHSGFTINQIATSAAAISSLKPNVVLLHAGTNDAFQNTESASAAVTVLGKLIDQIYTQWPGVTLLVAKVIPTSIAASQTYLNTLNAGIPGLVSTRAAAGRRIAVVDQSVLTTADLTDGIHPTVAGYKKMADIWFAGLQSVAAKGWLATATTTGMPAPAPAPTSTSTSAPGGATPPSPTPTPTGGSVPVSGSVAHYGQCGGTGYTGATVCESPYTCKAANQYYSQCL